MYFQTIRLENLMRHDVVVAFVVKYTLFVLTSVRWCFIKGLLCLYLARVLSGLS